MDAAGALLDTARAGLAWAASKRVTLPVSRVLSSPLATALTTALNLPATTDSGIDPTISFFWVGHSIILTMWFASNRESPEGKPGRTKLGAWVQGVCGFFMLNMTGNFIAGLLTGRVPFMMANPELTPSYVLPYILITGLSYLGVVDLPKLVMGTKPGQLAVGLGMSVFNAVANTMVVVGSIDLALFDPSFAQSIGRSLPGQFMLAYISSIGGGLALDGLQLLKLDWTLGLPQGFKEINGAGSLVFKVLAQATVLYMIAVNPHLGALFRILFNLPAEEKPTSLIEPGRAKGMVLIFVMGSYLFFNLIAPMLASKKEEKRAPPTPKMERTAREGTPMRRK